MCQSLPRCSSRHKMFSLITRGSTVAEAIFSIFSIAVRLERRVLRTLFALRKGGCDACTFPRDRARRDRDDVVCSRRERRAGVWWLLQPTGDANGRHRPSNAALDLEEPDDALRSDPLSGRPE